MLFSLVPAPLYRYAAAAGRRSQTPTFFFFTTGSSWRLDVISGNSGIVSAATDCVGNLSAHDEASGPTSGVPQMIKVLLNVFWLADLDLDIFLLSQLKSADPL